MGCLSPPLHYWFHLDSRISALHLVRVQVIGTTPWLLYIRYPIYWSIAIIVDHEIKYYSSYLLTVIQFRGRLQVPQGLTHPTSYLTANPTSLRMNMHLLLDSLAIPVIIQGRVNPRHIQPLNHRPWQRFDPPLRHPLRQMFPELGCKFGSIMRCSMR